ncbi:MAG: cupredoxin domain-containing protein [Alphaproteobacteria bacterium]|nr:MAG: cupredoxin domain-containing protein [Alphaproteobacteria bacterium]
MKRRQLLRSAMLAAAFVIGAGQAVLAQDTTLQLTVENGQFSPAELQAPANKPLVIVIKNNGAKAMEFESVSLRIEKVVAAKSQGSVRVRALAPGRYEFFDDFNKSTKGTLVVQ